MFFVSLYLSLRAMRRAKPFAYSINNSNVDEVIRNAAAYAWEIGSRKLGLVPEVATSQDNPFLDVNWRDHVSPG